MIIALCHSNTPWGSSRLVIKMCVHVAHLKCVETHTLSLHQRAAGEQPYDGRFAANNSDGEFLSHAIAPLQTRMSPWTSMAKTITRESPTLVLYDGLCNRSSQAPGLPERSWILRRTFNTKLSEVWIPSLPGNGCAMGSDNSQPEKAAAAVAPSDPKVGCRRRGWR